MPLWVCIYNPHFEKLSQHLDICFFHLSPQKVVCFHRDTDKLEGIRSVCGVLRKQCPMRNLFKKLGTFFLEEIKLRDDRGLISKFVEAEPWSGLLCGVGIGQSVQEQ